MAVDRRWTLCFDNGFGRTPPFEGNTDSAVGALFRVDSGGIKVQSVKIGNLFIHDDGPFRAFVNADAALETFVGNFIGHVILLFHFKEMPIPYYRVYPSSGHILSQGVASLSSLGNNCRKDFSVCLGP
jgi:hypothetical protein